MNKANPPDTFLRLRDTVDVYGAPGSVVRVNATADGLEFGSAVKIAQLPTVPAVGDVASVTDGTAGLAWGAIVTGGGTNVTKYLIWYNGSNWTVVGQ